MTGRGGRVRLFARWATSCVALSAVVYLASGRWPEVRGAAGAIEPVLLAAAYLASVAGGLVIPAVASWQSVRHAGMDWPLRHLVSVNFVVKFYSMILPRGAATVVRWWRYRDASSSPDSLALVTFEKVSQLAAVGAVSVVGFIADPTTSVSSTPVLAAGLAGFFIVAVALMALFVGGADRFLTAALRRLLPRRLVARAERFVEAVRRYRALRGLGTASVVAWQVFGVFCLALAWWLAMHGLQEPVGLATMCWIRSIVFVALLFPLGVGGLGIRELTSFGLLTAVGVTDGTAILFAGVQFAMQLMSALIGSLVELRRLHHR